MRRPQNNKLRTLRRHYAWIDGQVWRIQHDLHTKLVAGEVRLPQFANTNLRIVAVMAARRPGRDPIIQVNGSTYKFDQDGELDFSDQADAAQDILGSEKIQENVIDVQMLLRGRRWRDTHQWKPSASALLQIEADIFPEKRRDGLGAAPTLNPKTPNKA